LCSKTEILSWNVSNNAGKPWIALSLAQRLEDTGRIGKSEKTAGWLARNGKKNSFGLKLPLIQSFNNDIKFR
jgi:hypothetical protein